MERQRANNRHLPGSRLLSLILLLLCFVAPGLVQAAERIVMVSLPDNSAHQQFISAFKAELSQLDPGVEIVEKSVDKLSNFEGNDLLVTLGSSALKETAHLPVRKFHALISHALYQEFYKEDDVGAHHLVFNQPLERILRLQALTLPQSRNIGLLLGQPYPMLSRNISRLKKNFDRNIVVEVVEEDFTESLSSLLDRSDTLVLIPDARVINRNTVNALVLESYHRQIPLIGYSQALVKAGAMMALYSTSEQMGIDSAQLVSRMLHNRKLNQHNYPSQFGVAVNYKLSRAYELTIPSEESLLKQLMAGERK